MARIAFFGTPEFAVPSLRTLIEAQAHGHEVVLVVCQTDKPQGRGNKLTPPPTKELALQHNIRVAQPETLKAGTPSGEDFFALFTSLGIDLAVVAAYGRILPRRLLAAARLPFVNVHASLLPRWRGAAPIQRAIEAGDTETGCCLMHMVFELDAGGVYARTSLPIAANETSESLTPKLAEAGAQLLGEKLDDLLHQRLPLIAQPDEGITYAHQLRKEEGLFTNALFASDTATVLNRARAFYPWPGVTTHVGPEALKLFLPFDATANYDAAILKKYVAGTVIAAVPHLVIKTQDGAIGFCEGQLPSRRRISFTDLVRGFPIVAGQVVGQVAG